MTREWQVYRGGALWLTEAPDVLTAVLRAQDWFTRGPTYGERYAAEREGVPVRKPSRRLGAAGPNTLAAPGEYQPVVMVHESGLYGSTPGVLVVRANAGSGAEVEHVATVDRHAVLQQALTCLDRRDTVHAIKLRSLRGVELYKSGKRAGQPRFTRQHATETRQQVVADLAWNAELESRKQETIDCLNETLSVLLGDRVTAQPIETEQALDVYATQIDLMRAGVPWERSDVKQWLDTQTERVARLRSKLESVRVFGFPVGARVHVLRSPYWQPGDDEPEGIGEVIAIHVDTVQNLYSLGDRTEHRRVVRMSDGREWGLLVHRLAEP